MNSVITVLVVCFAIFLTVKAQDLNDAEKLKEVEEQLRLYTRYYQRTLEENNNYKKKIEELTKEKENLSCQLPKESKASNLEKQSKTGNECVRPIGIANNSINQTQAAFDSIKLQYKQYANEIDVTTQHMDELINKLKNANEDEIESKLQQFLSLTADDEQIGNEKNCTKRKQKILKKRKFASIEEKNTRNETEELVSRLQTIYSYITVLQGNQVTNENQFNNKQNSLKKLVDNYVDCKELEKLNDEFNNLEPELLRNHQLIDNLLSQFSIANREKVHELYLTQHDFLERLQTVVEGFNYL